MSRTATATATDTDTCVFDLDLQGVPQGMPKYLQVHMVFHPDSGVVEDTQPLWTTAHTHGAPRGGLPVGVAHALEMLAREALHSTQVRHMVVDFVDKHGAHHVETPGTMTLTMDLSDLTQVRLPCEAVLQLDM